MTSQDHTSPTSRFRLRKILTFSFRQGVHNVMEPAGMGLPVLVGPVHKNSAEAMAMIKSGGAVCASDARGIEAALEGWTENLSAREKAGRSALLVVERSAGATARTLELVEQFLVRGNNPALTRGDR